LGSRGHKVCDAALNEVVSQKRQCQGEDITAKRLLDGILYLSAMLYKFKAELKKTVAKIP
jgi:hypothetical protein